MKRWQQMLSWYLAVCLVFASAVGISPQLHLWFEHGGHGHAHSHAGFYSGAVEAEHTHPHPHPEDVPQPRQAENDLARILDAKHPHPKLFGLQPMDVYRALGRVLVRIVQHLPVAPMHDSGKGHTHHSLSQMLLSGTVEGVADLPPLVQRPATFITSITFLVTQFTSVDFDPQSASRAPPALI